ncbi:aminoglycoside phosphotransferase/kinase family protein [Glycomyces albidus]|uniref:Aminoglycoside phosphotransferase n=1 Tax=Glycomyces albidus TaxID=2656774 RepID=A0A6L5G3W8_9ACTN|nr:aminoglycoside phosphotransferase [Glycomyces albidus]MQM24008.1 aminoglycoside phosphotransferase [Glycomyces albidus]
MLEDPRHSPIGTPLSAAKALAHNTGNQATGGIWAVSGPGGDAVLKHLTPAGTGHDHWPASADPRHWNYWRREYLAYTSGFAAGYGADAGIGAPALLAAGERADGSLELWLERVQGVPGRDWTVEDLAEFANRLGTVQGRPRAELEWHSRGFLRQYAGRLDVGPLDWDHPRAAAHWPADLRAGLRMIWERRTDLFDRTETLPQTACHLDVWPMNLYRRTGGEFALFDWSFTGRGAVGEDLANLIADTFFDGLQSVDRLADTETALTGAYLRGLARAGHRGEAQARIAVAAAGAAKYCWLAPAMLTRLAAGRPVGSADYDSSGDDTDILERRRPIFAMLVRWARTALDA